MPERSRKRRQPYLPVWIARLLPVDLVEIRDLKIARSVRLNRWIELPPLAAASLCICKRVHVCTVLGIQVTMGLRIDYRILPSEGTLTGQKQVSALKEYPVEMIRLKLDNKSPAVHQDNRLRYSQSCTTAAVIQRRQPHIYQLIPRTAQCLSTLSRPSSFPLLGVTRMKASLLLQDQTMHHQAGSQELWKILGAVF
jgi:hypothetical protein